MASLEEQAATIWKQIRANLEDRSVLRMDDVDDELEAEIEAEQIEAIASPFRPTGMP